MTATGAERRATVLVHLAWYACSEPERPNDPYIIWHWTDCVGCRTAAQATMLRHPDDGTVARVLGPLAGTGGPT